MTEKQYGIIGTVLLHSIVLLILLFAYISLSKPVTSEGGILINFGDVESALGPSEPEINPPAKEAAASASQPRPVETEDGMLTQDFEEAPAIKKPAEKKKEVKKTETKPIVKPAPAKSTAPATPTVNKKAMYSNKSSSTGQSTTTTGSSEGIYKGTGNMGSPEGTPESDNYSKGLGGDGPGFDLSGRSSVHLSEPAFNVMKDGKVVVEITVDRNGRVISATPGVKGSTLVDNTLYAAAKKAALESKFNVKNDAPEKQIGTITYHFKLN